MQARGGGGHRAGMASPDGLVILAVLFVGRAQRGDIGRQRHRPGLGQRRLEAIALGVKGQQTARLGDFGHLGRQPVGKADAIARAQLAQGLGQR